MAMLRPSLLVLIVMLWIPTGVHAHCDGVKHSGDHPHCADSGGDTLSEIIGVHGDASAFDPTVTPWSPTDDNSTCVLQRNSGKSLSGAFPRHDSCAILMTDADSLTDDIIIVVDTNRRGEVVSVQVQGQDTIGAEGIVYISDLMSPLRVDNNADGNMVIHLHAENVAIHRCDTHVLKKKTSCNEWSGTFSIGDLVYSLGP